MVSTILVGCSSEDEEKVQFDVKDLVGFWILCPEEGIPDDELNQFGFFEDGTCNYTYSYEGEDDYSYEFAKGVYTLQGNTLTTRLTTDDGTDIWTFTIVSLIKKNRLVLKDEDGEIEVYEYYKTN